MPRCGRTRSSKCLVSLVASVWFCSSALVWSRLRANLHVQHVFGGLFLLSSLVYIFNVSPQTMLEVGFTRVHSFARCGVRHILGSSLICCFPFKLLISSHLSQSAPGCERRFASQRLSPGLVPWLPRSWATDAEGA